MPDQVSIEINNMSKHFNKNVALDNISLQVFRNEIFGLIGPNGSGKTTLLRIMCTLMNPDQGSPEDRNGSVCKIAGYDLHKEQSQIRERIGYVPQQDALYNDLSALDNLIYFSTPYSSDQIKQRERIEYLLHLVKLDERRHDLVRSFSGGMKKRLSIACALIHNPEVLLLDEITVGLDTALRHEIWALLKEQKRSSAIVITTHYIPEAEQHCDRVALMLNGRILDFGAPGELIDRHKPAPDLEEVMLIHEKNLA